MKRTLLSVLVLFLIVMSGCGDIEEPTLDEDSVTPPGVTNGGSYPALSGDQLDEGYPAPTESESGYPASSQEGEAYPSPLTTLPGPYPAPHVPTDESKRFTIELPLKDGLQEISGTGVAGISIKVISVSNAGESLGFGVVKNNGEFTIRLNRPGEGGELLGLQFADDSTAALLEGVPGTDMPMIGLILDQALVER